MNSGIVQHEPCMLAHITYLFESLYCLEYIQNVEYLKHIIQTVLTYFEKKTVLFSGECTLYYDIFILYIMIYAPVLGTSELWSYRMIWAMWQRNG
jgi:hypothetical protein